MSNDIKPAACGWSQDGDSYSDTWATSCGHYFRLDDGTPTDNKMAFCCYCGKSLVSYPFVEDEDEYLDLDDVCAGHPLAQRELAALRAEVAGLREDAERYREWKRAFREGECALWNALCEGQSDAEHDAAIDAALAARKGEA